MGFGGLSGFGGSGKKGLSFVGNVLGFQTGGVQPGYDRPDVYDPVGTKADVQKLLALYGEVLDALRSGNTSKFLSEEFQARLNDALVPLKAAGASARDHVLQNAARLGLDPTSTARLLAEADRSYGSEAAATGRNIVGQRGNLIMQLLTQIPGFVSGQQKMYSDVKNTENEWDAQRTLQRDARDEKNAATVRSYASFFAGGGAGGMMGMMGGGGGGFFGGEATGGGAGGYGYDPVSDSIKPRSGGVSV